jgi:DNA-binding transcriptional regulator GbsR (MarR family)
MAHIFELATPARLDVLYIFHRAKAPLSLRNIEELSLFSLRPIQLAIKDLEDCGLIQKKLFKNRHLFQLKKMPEEFRAMFD